MSRPNRRDTVSPDEVGVYHCYSRCVRGAYLCGFDRKSGIDYSYRKDWIIERQELLATIFAAELLAFIILDNHMHHVLRTRPDVVAKWSDEEVVRRWFRLHPPRSERGKPQEVTDERVAGALQDQALVQKWRERLGGLSWYMKELKEYTAKRANRESGVTGSFFDDRFKSPRLADVFTLLVCLLYVDLNAVHAGIVEQPEQYRYSSFHLRSLAHRLRQAPGSSPPGNASTGPDSYLQPLPEEGEPGNCTAPGKRPSDKGCVPFGVAHYLALVDWVGRVARRDKRGSIPDELPPILERLGGSDELLAESPVLYEQLYRRGHRRIQMSTPSASSEAAA